MLQSLFCCLGGVRGGWRWGAGGNAFDGVGFGELREVGEEVGGDEFPVLALGKTEVDMRGGEFVGVELGGSARVSRRWLRMRVPYFKVSWIFEKCAVGGYVPDVFFPTMLDELFVCR